jgi:hypothetical protein
MPSARLGFRLRRRGDWEKSNGEEVDGPGPVTLFIPRPERVKPTLAPLWPNKIKYSPSNCPVSPAWIEKDYETLDFRQQSRNATLHSNQNLFRIIMDVSHCCLLMTRNRSPGHCCLWRRQPDLNTNAFLFKAYLECVFKVFKRKNKYPLIIHISIM